MTETRRNDLDERLARYGGRIVQFTTTLPHTRQGRHLEDQLLRAGTAAGANYGEAQGAQSRGDFIHKLSLALKEAREALFWLRVARDAGMGGENLAWLLDEGDQIVAMLQAGKNTAQQNARER